MELNKHSKLECCLMENMENYPVMKVECCSKVSEPAVTVACQLREESEVVICLGLQTGVLRNQTSSMCRQVSSELMGYELLEYCFLAVYAYRLYLTSHSRNR